MEPDTQVEIQLGHMCNNRCVFCVSGQRTQMRMARPLETAPILARIEAARAEGHRKITLLGGEPTLQPGFLEVVRRCVALGFEEIVIFTNGVKIARAAFIDEVRATGGRFNWRISIQGATKESHERTTGRPGSFDRIVAAMGHLAERGEKLTVNMCVVGSNYESVDHFPDLLDRFGARQLHLDLMRPLDAGERTDAELEAMMVPYSQMVGPLTRMIAGFPEGFDVNLGNLPFCIAPELAPYIHHDGETTYTVAIEGDDQLSQPWDKYQTKRRDKFQPETCRPCLFREKCSGVFEHYARFHGTAELVPVDAARLRRADPGLRLLPLHLKPVIAGLKGFRPPPPFTGLAAKETADDEVTLTLTGPEPLEVALRRPGEVGICAFEGMSLHLRAVPGDLAVARAGLEALVAALAATCGAPVHPLGDDALAPLPRTVAARLGRLRGAAPFPGLAWTSVAAAGGRVELGLADAGGAELAFWLAEEAGRPTGGYRVVSGAPAPAAIEGLKAMMAALRRPRAAAA